MTEQAGSTGAGTRFVINMIGAVGLVFGVLPIVRYLLQLPTSSSSRPLPTTGWQLEGAARDPPPAIVLVVCIVVAYVLEQRLSRD